MANPAFSAKDSFRVPNSIVQGLTTCTAAGLNGLTAFQMVTLLGLLTQVSPKYPSREVRTSVSKILHILEVSNNVAHAVDREWETTAGEKRRRKYSGRRFSPTHIQKVHDALLTLHQQTVVIRTANKQRAEVSDRIVHVLDLFGYVYERDGEVLDLDDVPPGHKVNVGTEDRPVFRIRKLTGQGNPYDRPSGVLFRLNTELSHELIKKKGTIGHTLIARKVFGLFRQHMCCPAAIRLILLVLRQTDKKFTRHLGPAIEGLGWDITHPKRAAIQCEDTLLCLQAEGLVVNFDLDQVNDKLRIEVNREWYRDGP